MKYKPLLFLLLLFQYLTDFSQESLNMGFGGGGLNFEDSTQYKFVKIDTNKVWFIGKPNKPNLFLPNDNFYKQFAIYTDTNIYYKPSTFSSFQFKLHLLSGCNGYTIIFYHKYNFEAHKDGGIIETSWDKGLSWNNIIFDTIIQQNIFSTQNLYNINDTIAVFNNQPGFTGQINTIIPTTISFYANFSISAHDTLILRFTIKSDTNNSSNEGWMLDNFIFGGFLVGIDNINLENKINIFPNPAKEIVTIDYPYEPIKQIFIYNVYGEKIEEFYNTNSLKVNNLTSGIYFFRINNKFTKKIIINQN